MRNSFMTAGFIVLMLLALFPTIQFWAWAESKVFPVVSSAEIVQTRAVEGGIEIYVRFEKHRECEFVGLAWYRGDPNGHFERVVLEFREPNDDSDSSRPAGDQSTGPWFLSLTEKELFSQSFAIVSHRCHPIWLTRTEFYP